MSAWGEHVSAALLGTRRRPVPPLDEAPPLVGAPTPVAAPPPDETPPLEGPPALGEAPPFDEAPRLDWTPTLDEPPALDGAPPPHETPPPAGTSTPGGAPRPAETPALDGTPTPGGASVPDTRTPGEPPRPDGPPPDETAAPDGTPIPGAAPPLGEPPALDGTPTPGEPPPPDGGPMPGEAPPPDGTPASAEAPSLDGTLAPGEPPALDRAPAPGEAPPDGTPGLDEVPAGPVEPAARLLEQAAVLTARRRAGWRPVTAEPIAPAPAETAPIVPPAAAVRLRRILSGEYARVLPEWLDAAAHSGRRVPAHLLPDLLHKGRSDRALRPSIARAAGRRGVWLAMRNLDWAYLVVASGGDSAQDPEVWKTGARAQRVAHLMRLRATDPATARTTLSSTWAREPAPERALFLTTFERGLSLADEDFLEDALDDRGLEVRRIAADLLARLPGSAHAGRMADRARACLRPRSGAAATSARPTACAATPEGIVVAPPADHDEAMRRDGIPYHAVERIGNHAGWLREILARTPLSAWTDRFGTAPERIVRLPIVVDASREPDAGRTRDVHLGWARAAARQRDAAWARALLAGDVVLGEVTTLADLLDVLPAVERDDAAAEAVRRIEGHADRLTVLERVPGPWAGALADAVAAALAAAASDPDGERFPVDLARLAGERLGPATAPRLADLVRRHPACRPLSELADVLRFRHDMLEELR
ncbi:DUF5691 domain-containing protein [Actinoallomurus sp. CA-150999]|uniref:DUF5691 domain-containing protein n=1 Tax=Actinoallomurus sp. CA-150999 TaxID=3239887 RepID=UPI003D8B944D